jgi:hypothetical protein
MCPLVHDHPCSACCRLSRITVRAYPFVGGVLLDSRGRLVGINTAIADPTGKGSSSGVVRNIMPYLKPCTCAIYAAYALVDR